MSDYRILIVAVTAPILVLLGLLVLTEPTGGRALVVPQVILASK
jgi:hypothetical protein